MKKLHRASFAFYINELQMQITIDKIKKAKVVMVDFGKACHALWYKQLRKSGLISPCRYL